VRQLVELIIGRKLAAETASQRVDEPVQGDACLKATHVSGDVLRDVTFELPRGSIVGVTGVVGSGFEELVYLLVGAKAAFSGTCTVGTREIPLKKMTPRLAVQLGVALLPADRQHAASAPGLTVSDNVMLPMLHQYFRGLRLRTKELNRAAVELCREFDVRPPDPSASFFSLSGGNQQKAILAKWLGARPSVLLVDEPTAGVDVGARQEVYAVIRSAAADGLGVLCASSDYNQLATLCDRVLVIAEGRIVKSLVREQLTKSQIAEAVYVHTHTQTDGSDWSAV
jgi:ribose transport system ATP-binding protein